MQRRGKSLKTKKNYICMKKELGKWLMDIAKYIATAVVISSIFTESKGALFWIGAFLAIAATLFSGLWLINLTYKRKE